MTRYCNIILFSAGTLPLAGALLSQYGFGYAPCTLCVWQRVPYVLAVLLAICAMWRPQHHRNITALIALCCAASGTIGAFHAGVEQGWWAFESACTSGLGVSTSLEDLRSAIASAPLVACNQAMLNIGGISMAAGNALYGIALAAWLIARGQHAFT